MQTRTKRAKRVERGTLTGEGASVREAKADLSAKIDAALEGTYRPVVINYKSWTAIVYRDPTGWYYLLNEQFLPGRDSFGYCMHYHGDREVCIQHAAFHVLQNACDVYAIRNDADVPEWLSDDKLRSDLVYWCRWQRAAAWAKVNMPELDNNQLHRWACEHNHEEQFA